MDIHETVASNASIANPVPIMERIDAHAAADEQ
jgi:hypothetical protein